MDKTQIAAFLKAFKSFAVRPGGWTLVPRRKNLESIMEMGITIPQVKAAILGLKVTDYSSGPEADRDRQGINVWVFGAKMNADGIYIKLSDNFRGDQAKCLSFHKAEFPIRKPFKESEGGK
ncbi:MAG: hypothetical protein Q8R76_00670 [Candidatus Omnitrophota bacterium]|nr:hypothetical protein [Candidatus Omnitrophota bacterium]